MPKLQIIKQIGTVGKDIVTGSVGSYSGLCIAERQVLNPKQVALYYYTVAKACYVSTGSKRLACIAAGSVCLGATIPGTHQSIF